MFGSVQFRFGKQNFDWLVLFGSGRTVKHCFGWSLSVQAFLDFWDFRFNLVYNSILFSSPLVTLSNPDLQGFCFPLTLHNLKLKPFVILLSIDIRAVVRGDAGAPPEFGVSGKMTERKIDSLLPWNWKHNIVSALNCFFSKNPLNEAMKSTSQLTKRHQATWAKYPTFVLLTIHSY